MQLKNVLGSLALAVSMASVGCTVSGEAHVRTPTVAVVEVETAPPEPVYEVEVTQVRPGFVWVGGFHEWVGGRYVWRPGHWERERAGHYWVAAHYENIGGRYRFVAGHWQAGAAPVVRDHRGPAPAPGPVVRDHR